MSWFHESVIENEERIVWLEDIEPLDYVRQMIQYAARRAGPPIPQKYLRDFWPGTRIVGYAELKPDAPNNGSPGTFERRVFWLKAHDRDSDPTGVYRTGTPAEAVDPRTVSPGVHGENTDRSWSGP